MNRHHIEVDIDVMAETRAAAGRLADLVAEYVAQLVEEDPGLSLSLALRPTCVATIRDDQ